MRLHTRFGNTKLGENLYHGGKTRHQLWKALDFVDEQTRKLDYKLYDEIRFAKHRFICDRIGHTWKLREHAGGITYHLWCSCTRCQHAKNPLWFDADPRDDPKDALKVEDERRAQLLKWGFDETTFPLVDYWKPEWGDKDAFRQSVLDADAAEAAAREKAQNKKRGWF